MAFGKIWGIKEKECLLDFPCDNFMQVHDDILFRGLSIQSSPEIIFRWLCQMRIAPYSYDWIDNLGRRSPRKLTPELEKLEIGQTVMAIFDVVDFTLNEHITIRTKKERLITKLFGDVAVSYLIVPENNENCRLLVKVIINYPKKLIKILFNPIFSCGDLIMMRRQLLNFKQLAEETSTCSITLEKIERE